MKIKVKEFKKGLYTNAKDENGNLIPFINPKGDWIDLRALGTYKFNAPQSGTLKTHVVNGQDVKYRDVTFDCKLIDLGIAMQLPKGIVAKIKQRSSTTMKLHILPATSGAIDNSYNGNEDMWKLYAVALDHTTINEGDRICQFTIELSQFATFWQKLKWLISKPKFVFVDELNNTNRGGHGSTGLK
jgi:dUTP pyrophosphatase